MNSDTNCIILLLIKVQRLKYVVFVKKIPLIHITHPHIIFYE